MSKKTRKNISSHGLQEEVDKLHHKIATIDLENSARMDSIYTNLITGQGTRADVNEMTRIKPFIPYSISDVENLYSMDPIIKTIINTITRYVFKDGFSIKSDNLIYDKKFKKLLKKYKVWDKIKSTFLSGYVHGQAFMLLAVNGKEDYSQPLYCDEIKKLDNIYVINRFFLASYPEEVDFEFNPAYYFIINQPLAATEWNLNDSEARQDYLDNVPKMGKQKIHKTRMQSVYGNKLMPYTYRSNLHFHDSYIRCIQNAAKNYSQAMDNIATLLGRIPMAISKISGLNAAMLSPQEKTKMAAAMRAREKYRSSNNLSVMDVNEEYEYYTPSLAGINELIREAKERLCLESDIPHDVLFNEGSIGNTSGRTEKSTFQSFIDSERTEKVSPILEYFMKVFESCEGLKVPDDAEVNWSHTEKLTEVEEAQAFSAYASGSVSLEGQGYDCSEFLNEKYPAITRPEGFEVDLMGDQDNKEGKDEPKKKAK